MPQTFISYCRRDASRPELESLIADLNGLNQDVWQDTKSIIGGEDWWSTTLRQIRGSTLFVLVASESSLLSEACQSELDYALRLKRPFVCVKIDKISAMRLPKAVALTQVVDYSDRLASAADGARSVLALANAVTKMTQSPPPPLPDPLPEPPGVPDQILIELRDLLHRKELNMSQQEQFLNKIRQRSDNPPWDEFISLLHDFLKRADVSVKSEKEARDLLEDVERMKREREDGAVDLIRPPAPTNEGGGGGRQDPSRDWKEILPAGVAEHMKRRSYYAGDLDLTMLEHQVTDYLQSKKLEVQSHDPGGVRILQARSPGWQRTIGAGVSPTIVMWMEGETLHVAIGGAKWIDKAAAAGVGWFLFWPAIIPAVAGGWKQSHLPGEIFNLIGKKIPECRRTSTRAA